MGAMQHLGRQTIVALCGAFTSACGVAGAHPGECVPIDMGRIPLWTLHDVPTLTVGGADERAGFTIARVADVKIGGSYLIVGDVGDAQVRFYSMDGRLAGAFGQSGAGPGEFRDIRNIAVFEDTNAVVWDAALRRVTTLSPSGVVSTVQPDLSVARGFAPALVGVLSDGALVFEDVPPTASLQPQKNGERRDTTTYIVVNANGTFTGRAYAVPGRELQQTGSGSDWGSVEVIFGNRSVGAASNRGLVIAKTDSITLDLVESHDGTNERIEVPFTAVQARPDWVKLEREKRIRDLVLPSEALRRVGAQADRARMDEMDRAAIARLAAVPHRGIVPPICDLVSDGSDNAWIRLCTPCDDRSSHWLVISLINGPVGRVEVPVAMELMAASGSAIVTHSVDHLGRETVSLRRFTSTE